MNVFVKMPDGETRRWYLDPEDNWTVEQLCEDVAYSCRRTRLSLTKGGDRVPSGKATDILNEGDELAVE